MIQKRSFSVSTKFNTPSYDMVNISVVITENVNTFSIYETFFENVIIFLPITYQTKTKILGKK